LKFKNSIVPQKMYDELFKMAARSECPTKILHHVQNSNNILLLNQADHLALHQGRAVHGHVTSLEEMIRIGEWRERAAKFDEPIKVQFT
jgi:hypothetical protein